MNFNFIKGSLAFGKQGGYFYSDHSEGLISLDEGISETLKKPYRAGDYSLGKRMKDYQHALLKLERGRELSDKDLDFICEMIGTEVLEKKENSSQFLLKPFEMKLNLKLIGLEHKTVNDIKNTYEAKNVKAGNWGFGGNFGIRYDLVLKNSER